MLFSKSNVFHFLLIISRNKQKIFQYVHKQMEVKDRHAKGE